jgi:hypothetical protein
MTHPFDELAKALAQGARWRTPCPGVRHCGGSEAGGRARCWPPWGCGVPGDRHTVVGGQAGANPAVYIGVLTEIATKRRQMPTALPPGSWHPGR